MTSGGSNNEWFLNFMKNLPQSSTAAAKPKPAPNATYNYQRVNTPVSQKVNTNIGTGYRYGTGDANDPSVRMAQNRQAAQANLNRINQARPVWAGPDVANTNAEYKRMNPYTGRANYDADLANFNAQKQAAQAQLDAINNSTFAKQQHGYRYGNTQNRPNYAARSAGIEALPQANKTRWQ